MIERSDTFRICERKEAGTPAGVQDLMSRLRPVVSSLTLFNHRLLAAMPQASSRSKSVINGREEYRVKITHPEKSRCMVARISQQVDFMVFRVDTDEGLFSVLTPSCQGLPEHDGVDSFDLDVV